MFFGHRTAYSGRTTRNQHRIIQELHFSFPRLLLLGISDPLSESLCSSEQIYVARNEAGANRLFAGWCSHYNFRNGVGVKNSPMPRLQFTKRFVIVRNSDFRAPVVREFDILGTPNPKLVAISNGLNASASASSRNCSIIPEPGSNPESTSRTPSKHPHN